MFPLSRNFLKFAAAGALLALTAATPALADEMTQNLGPVGPHEPMITTVGSKSVIAFYVPGNGGCNVQVVIWNGNDTEATTAAGMRVSLNPGQTASIDSAENKSLTLKCGGDAEPSRSSTATRAMPLTSRSRPDEISDLIEKAKSMPRSRNVPLRRTLRGRTFGCGSRNQCPLWVI